MPENENKTNVDVKGSVGKSVVVSGDGNTIINVRIENISELIEILSEANLSQDDMEKPHKADILEIVNIIKKIGASERFIKLLNDIPPQSDNTDFVHKIPEHNVKVRIKPDKQDQLNPIHLLVKLKPNPFTRDLKGQELFTVEIYLWKSPSENDCKLRIDNCLLADVRKELDSFISEFKDDDEIKTIELILPCELIALDADQWIMEEGRSFKIKFGKKYPILARLDRRFALHRPKQKVPAQLRQDWKNKWKLFDNHAHESSVLWVNNHQAYDPENLCEDFTCSENASCIFMTFMPSENHDGKGLGDVILDAGIPVALCYRKNGNNIVNPEIIENKMKEIVSDKSLSDLPTLIRNERKKAKQEEDIGNHLTLIWDDPNRVPEEDKKEVRDKHFSNFQL